MNKSGGRISSRKANNEPLQALHKPFKPPMISGMKQAASMTKIKGGLLDIDSEEDFLDDISDGELNELESQVMKARQSSPFSADTTGVIEDEDTALDDISNSLNEEGSQKENILDLSKVEEIEDVDALSPFPSAKKFNGKKGKYASKRETDMVKERQRKQNESEAKATIKTEGILKTYEGLARVTSMFTEREKAEAQVKAAELEKKAKDPLNMGRYTDVLQKYGIKPDKRALELCAWPGAEDASPGKKYKWDNPLETIDLITPIKLPSSKTATSGELPYICPICYRAVSKGLYQSYPPDLHQRASLKAKLHKSHRIADAYDKSRELGIPTTIDWKALPERCKKYFPYLQDIITKKEASHYRDFAERYYTELKKVMKNRRKAQFDDGEWQKSVPGYYGDRGSNILSEAIMGNRKIKSTLERLGAKGDVIIMGAGIGVYTQIVLVRELGMRLIMEDMGIPDDQLRKGRKLLEETVAIGQLLNQEDNSSSSDEDDDDNDDDDDEHADGMDWWWKEQREKQEQGLVEEPEDDDEEDEIFEASQGKITAETIEDDETKVVKV